MGIWQESLNRLNSIFHNAVDIVKECYSFAPDTYSANEVKAGLFLHARGNSRLLEDTNPLKDAARNAFLSKVDVHDGMAHNEVFDIIEKLDLYMHEKFPESGQNRWEISSHAFVKADQIADDIRALPPEKIEHFAHKFDMMIGLFPKPVLAIDNTHG